MNCDALVIGGGPAGSSAALLLARAGWSVVLVERKAFPRRKVCGEYLSATNLPFFDELGIGDRFRALAGPPVTTVGLFAGRTIAHAPLPTSRRGEFGRALAREHLDGWLTEQARSEGADVRHGWTLDDLSADGDRFVCPVRTVDGPAAETMRPAVVIAAHGSWEPGRLPTQGPLPSARPADLLAFKAHFRNSDLPAGWMPLLAFPGGYGGMVRCDDGRVSLSCCIRRDRLASIRRQHSGDAGDAVLAHIEKSCLGVKHALAGASRESTWLAAGPIRPGIRVDAPTGIFRVGNAAGEAHPVVAEGISMAMQSSWLLAQTLIAWKSQGGRRGMLSAVQNDYAAQWRRSFAPRIWASCALAHWAMRALPVSLSLPAIRCFPKILNWGARITGKASAVVRPSLFARKN